MEQIKQIIKEIFQSMGFKSPEIEIKKDNSFKDKELLVVNIKINPKEAKWFTQESSIGLTALQHLIRILVFKKDITRPFLALDINEHKKERESFLIELALKTVQKVRRTKKPIILEPMSAYERRFIHLKLAEEPDIFTESTGEEPERKVVVRLYP